MTKTRLTLLIGALLLGGVLLLAACAPPTPPIVAVDIPTQGPSVTLTPQPDTPVTEATQAIEGGNTGDVTLSVTDVGATATPQPSDTTAPTETPVLTPTASPTLTPPFPLSGTTPTAIPEAISPQVDPVGFSTEGVTELVIPNRNHVVALAFLPDGRLLFTEKDGRIMLRQNDGTVFTALRLPSETNHNCGMLGIALDPSFATTGYVWALHNVSGNPHKIEVLRFALQGTAGTDVQVAASWPMFGNLCGRNGGSLAFGPDGMLYVSVGDIEDPANAQDLLVVPGKIHRFQPTMPLSVPADNPIPGSSVFAYGLQNSTDIHFDPLSGKLWSSEIGTPCEDELNLIVPGGNYGWDGGCNNASIGPVLTWENRLPAGVLIYTGDMFPEYQNQLFVCTTTNKWLNMYRLIPDRSNFDSFKEIEIGTALCETDIAQAPDGSIWFAGYKAIYRLRAP